MFTKMKFCYCRHGYEVLKVFNATDVCFLAKIPQNVRSDLFVCSLMDLMISDILKLHLCTISAVWDETTDIHYFLWLSSSYAEVELRIFWRNVGKFPKISRPLRHIKFWNMIGIWSVTWLFRTEKIFGVFAHGCKQNGGLLVGHFSSPRWDGYGAALNLLFSGEMSSIQSTLDALSSVDSLVGTLKACIWKQDKIIREQREEIENLKSLVTELEKERKELRRQIATERTNSSNPNAEETKTPGEKDRWGKIFV